MQLEVDADPMAPYMALPAAHLRLSLFSLSFVPFTVHGTFAVRLSGFSYLLDIDNCGQS